MHNGVRATAEQLSRDLAGDPKHIYDSKTHLAGDPERKGWGFLVTAELGIGLITPLLSWGACLYTKNQGQNSRMMKRVIRMQNVSMSCVLIGLCYWSCECMLSIYKLYSFVFPLSLFI